MMWQEDTHLAVSSFIKTTKYFASSYFYHFSVFPVFFLNLNQDFIAKTPVYTFFHWHIQMKVMSEK